jgi:hypothetical protein
VLDEVTVARAGHPLDGRRLRVDPCGGRRRDGRIQVLLPDGSASLFPVAWTDPAAPSTVADHGAAPPRFTADGLRRLVRLVDGLAGVTDGPVSGR